MKDCFHCGNFYTKTTANNPDYCSSECEEADLEKIAATTIDPESLLYTGENAHANTIEEAQKVISTIGGFNMKMNFTKNEDDSDAS